MATPLNQIEIDFKVKWEIDTDFNIDGHLIELAAREPSGEWYVDRAAGIIYSPDGEGREVKRKRRYDSDTYQYYIFLGASSHDEAEQDYQMAEGIYEGLIPIEYCVVSAYIEGIKLEEDSLFGIIDADDDFKKEIEEQLKAECIAKLRKNKDKFKRILQKLELI